MPPPFLAAVMRNLQELLLQVVVLPSIRQQVSLVSLDQGQLFVVDKKMSHLCFTGIFRVQNVDLGL